MKKYISLVLAFVMLFSLAACSGSDDPTLDNNQPSKVNSSNNNSSNPGLGTFAGKLTEPYAKIIATGNYLFEASADGESPITLAMHGDNISLTSLLDVAGNGTKTLVSLVKLDGQCYVVLPTEKAKNLVKSSTFDELQFDQRVTEARLDNVIGGTFEGSGEYTGTDGIEYVYEDYYSPVMLYTYRFIFTKSDSALVALGSKKSGEDKFSVVNIKLFETNEDTFNVIRSYSNVSDLNSAANANAGAGANANTAQQAN